MELHWILMIRVEYLTVVSRVSDKNSGDIGHPIQWDPTQSQWYTKGICYWKHNL